MTVHLIQRPLCGKKYAGSTKTKFWSRAKNYKSTHRKFVIKKEVQALKQMVHTTLTKFYEVLRK